MNEEFENEEIQTEETADNVETTEVETTEPATPEEKPVKDTPKAFSERLNKKTAEAKEEANAKALELLRKAGYQGNSLEDIELAITANEQGVDVDVLKTQQQQAVDKVFQSEKIQKLVNDSIELQKIKVWQEITKDHQNVPYKNIDELLANKTFDTLLTSSLKGETQLSASKIYEIALSVEPPTETPPNMPSLKSGFDNSDGEYFTSEEVDKLPASAYDNPKIMEKIRRSMLRWGK